MGQHCELMAQEFGITRSEQDHLALRSHQQAVLGKEQGILAQQIIPVGDIDEDNLVRADTTLERLARLPAVFDRSSKGTISAGNASALTDGASAVCLMAEDLARSNNLPIIGFMERVECASVTPGDGLLMGPALALPRLMQKSGWGIGEIDLFEVHEAFAAQVICNLRAWRDGWNRSPEVPPIGAIPEDKMNVFGGSMALGHPFAATGGRLILNICQALQNKGGQRGVISVCAAGGGAAAVAISLN